MAERCTVVTLDVRRLEDTAQDPALASLLAEGWTVAASVVVVPPGAEDPVLQVVLAPPRASTQKPWHALPSAALVGLALALATLVGQFVGVHWLAP
jgi:hypothetical protein